MHQVAFLYLDAIHGSQSMWSGYTIIVDLFAPKTSDKINNVVTLHVCHAGFES